MCLNMGGVKRMNEGGGVVLVENVEMEINMVDGNDIECMCVLKDGGCWGI